MQLVSKHVISRFYLDVTFEFAKGHKDLVQDKALKKEDTLSKYT